MDGVLADFYNAAKNAIKDNPEQKYPQSKFGFFLKIKPIENSIESFKLLEKYFDMWILTRPSSMNVNCFSEKAQWVWDHLGFHVLEKTIFSSDKSKVLGHYLIDDQENAKQKDFKGELIKFGSKKFPNWDSVIEYVFNKENIKN